MKRFFQLSSALCLLALLVPGAGAAPPLHQAAYEGKLDDVIRLIDKGADVNSRDNDGRTPVFFALYYPAQYSKSKKEKILTLLVEKGADVNRADYQGRTPLHDALQYANESAALLLIEKGAKVTARDKSGLTPLHEAARTGNLDLLRLLIEKGADANASDSSDWTPLHEAVDNRHRAAAALLIEKGAKVTAANEDGNTPLHIAAAEDAPGLASLLLARGAPVDAANEDKCTPLHLAAAVDAPEMVQVLAEKGANLDAADRDGWTPLHKAACFGSVRCASILVKNGADPDLLTEDGRSLFDLARDRSNSRMVSYLQSLRRSGACGNRLTGDMLRGEYAATSFLPDKSNSDTYSPARAFDGKSGTAWIEGTEKNGIGEKIAFRVKGAIKSVSIIGCYPKPSLFENHSRLKKARLVIYAIEAEEKSLCGRRYRLGDIEKKTDLKFEDVMEAQDFQVGLEAQENGLGYVCVLEIREVYPGAKFQNTCIAEIKVK